MGLIKLKHQDEEEESEPPCAQEVWEGKRKTEPKRGKEEGAITNHSTSKKNLGVLELPVL